MSETPSVKRNAFSADAIANYFIEHSDKPLTQLQILKLVYIAHGLYMAIYGRPLIDEEPEAWKYGPVIPTLRRRFVSMGSRPIESFIYDTMTKNGRLVMSIPQIEEEIPEYADEAASVLDQVLRVYGHLSGVQLSTLTHKPDSPWDQVYQKAKHAGGMCNATIPNSIIASHYKEFLGDKTSD